MPRRAIPKFFLLLASVLLTTVCNGSADRPRQERSSQPAPAATTSANARPASYDFASLDQTLERIARKHGGCAMHAGGRIAEVVSGRSWNELFVERIAAPLGMSQTDFQAYGPSDNPRPAGDGRSSVDDYARFLNMILQRGTAGSAGFQSLDRFRTQAWRCTLRAWFIQ